MGSGLDSCSISHLRCIAEEWKIDWLKAIIGQVPRYSQKRQKTKAIHQVLESVRYMYPNIVIPFQLFIPCFLEYNLRHYRYRGHKYTGIKTRAMLLAIIRRVIVGALMFPKLMRCSLSFQVAFCTRGSWGESCFCFVPLEQFWVDLSIFFVRKFLWAWVKPVLTFIRGSTFETFTLKFSVEVDHIGAPVKSS